MLKVLICDDDIDSIKNIAVPIEYRAAKTGLEIQIDKLTSPKTIINGNKAYDIAFVDIETGDINGLELSKELYNHNKSVMIIIVTSYNKYLDDAMRIRVFRYLSKPIDENRLLNAFNEAVREYYTANTFISVQTKGEVHKLAISEIMYIESIHHGSIIHTVREEIRTGTPTKELIEKLSESSPFIQSYHGLFVNLSFVVGFDHEKITLRKNEKETETVFMSQRKYRNFKAEYLKYAGGLL